MVLKEVSVSSMVAFRKGFNSDQFAMIVLNIKVTILNYSLLEPFCISILFLKKYEHSTF